MYTKTFGVWDYMVFSLMLIASIIIGIYHAVRGKNQSTTDYMVAGRSMTWLPVALSMIVTFQSSVMMLGTPAESYVYGFAWILAELGSATGCILEIILVLAFLKRLDLSSPYEYFERRFKSRGLRVLANVVSCISTIRYTGTVIYGQAIALQTVTGLSLFVAGGVTAGVTVLYTTIGGLKAVIWTDVLQSVIMFSGLLAVSIKGTIDAGGAYEVWNRAAQSGRLDFSVDPDPTLRHTVWNLFFGRILSGLGFLILPATLQRITATKSLGQCRRALFITIPGYSILIGMALAEGIVAYGYYSYKRCDPLASKQIESPNQIIPYMTVDLFRNMPGMSGVFLAALSSASLSTVSSSLSAISTITWYDLIQPCFPNMTDFRGLLVAKGTVIVSGVICCALAVLISLVGSHTLNQIVYTFYAITGMPIVGLFYLGAFFSFANAKGAVTGFITGVVFMGWLIIGSMLSVSGDSSPYFPMGSTDQCPALNVTTSVTNATMDISTTSYYDFSTSSLYNDTTTPGHGTKTKRSGLEVFYSLSYTLYGSMAVCVVLLVGTLVSLATGGWANRADPELVVQKSDIQFWNRSPRSPWRGHADITAEKMVMVESPT